MEKSNDCLIHITADSPVYCFETGNAILPGEPCLFLPSMNIYFCDSSYQYQSLMEVENFKDTDFFK